jgi:formyl-CoA transferase
MEANGVFAQIPDGPRTIQSPLNVDGAEKRQPSRAPDVGEHTVEVLKSLGYDDAAIEALVARGAAALHHRSTRAVG